MCTLASQTGLPKVIPKPKRHGRVVSDLQQWFSSVTETREVNTEVVQQCQIQTAGPSVGVAVVAELQHAPCPQPPAAAAGEQDRHLIGLVSVAVEQVRAAQEQRIVQQRALALGDPPHPPEQIGELRDMVL